jgi:glycosyltransferase involved in cell wall biosynthesis
MLCECVPIGTNVAGIPTVMDGIGFLVKYGDVPGLVGAIRKALDEPASTGEQARARISENFSLQKRESALVSLIAGGSE